MKQEDLNRLARAAGFDVYSDAGTIYATSECTAMLERVVAMATAEEREACAQLCDGLGDPWQSPGDYIACAAAIRARNGGEA